MQRSTQPGAVCVFLGPSLSHRAARQLWSLRKSRRRLLLAPPVAQGHLVRLVESDLKLCAIGIVDGVLRQRAAVSHKEILYAMQRGIRVYGAASMGALRAVECGRFGMVGVGRIVTDYREGRLEDDDEVVLAHQFDPKNDIYTPLSEPLCNIRYTLERAIERDVVSIAFSDRLIEYLQGLPFWERSLVRALDALDAQSEARVEESASLRDWLQTSRGYVDQKQLDAMTLIDTLASLSDPPPQADTADWTLSDTYGWQLICHRARSE